MDMAFYRKLTWHAAAAVDRCLPLWSCCCSTECSVLPLLLPYHFCILIETSCLQHKLQHRLVYLRATCQVCYQTLLKGRLVQGPSPGGSAPPPSDKPAGKAGRPERRVKMTRLRARVAERLKGAQNTYAMLTTFNEIDMTNIMQLRKDFKVCCGPCSTIVSIMATDVMKSVFHAAACMHVLMWL